ncbi:TetR/AcrR family transcriptional regulator [Pusillimonas noertemannii]|uniref:TetR family transcriptional regulator n=1 Tax=Pusillimonas noertemannii TaxID=305977 RepID=A0A2U1CNH5_9BURK|nr:TetR/AcrR family transcriptional regulator [Pusillimonas noertemannii]NYT68425.1 TetR/AcrR family transcriptional regulator [Pusillimonas noertemannii]PVY62558.1 TetR family transcriptional regulator [Pusillimonas noertemannii]TFL10491.1 TetR/AcrR family transcriptional regulator [Pusillimonas noertemannii]
MGRVSREQAQLNRQRVVESACRLFRMYGVENVSIADIMSEAGLTPGGFYKQFESKEALMDEAFAMAFKQASEAWAAITKSSESGDSLQALTALVQHYFKKRPPEQYCPMLVFSSLVGNSPTDSTTAQVYRQGVEELFGRFHAEAARASKRKQKQEPPLSEAEILLLFAAMIGTGFLERTVGRSALVGQMQSAVLEALAKS